MKKNFLIISGVTFGVFFAEALIHYNYGILESKNLPFKWENWTMASALSGLIIDKVEQQV